MSWRTALSFAIALLLCSTRISAQGNDTISARLKSYAAYSNDFARKVLYTWTTEEQVKELADTAQLLTRSRSSKGEYSIFDLELRTKKFRKNEVAELLRSQRFANKRFAWTAAWATSEGFGKEQYGEQLIKIVLKDSAIIGAFIPDSSEPFYFSDLAGRKVSKEFVLSHPNLLAAVYFEKRRTITRIKLIYRRYGTMRRVIGHRKIRASVPYREYVVCNEAMISEWSCGTKDITDDMREEQQLLNALMNTDPAETKASSVKEPWKKRNAPSLIDLYIASLAFVDDQYMPSYYKLQELVSIMQLRVEKQTTTVIHTNP